MFDLSPFQRGLTGLSGFLREADCLGEMGDGVELSGLRVLGVLRVCDLNQTERLFESAPLQGGLCLLELRGCHGIEHHEGGSLKGARFPANVHFPPSRSVRRCATRTPSMTRHSSASPAWRNAIRIACRSLHITSSRTSDP